MVLEQFHRLAGLVAVAAIHLAHIVAVGFQGLLQAGDRIAVVAKRNNKTVEELSDLLLRDRSAQISPEGFIVYNDSFDNAE
jgi:hypothetical protein